MCSHSPHPYSVGAYPYAVHVSAIMGDDRAVTIQGGLSDVCAGHDATYDHGLTQQNHGRGEQMTGDLSREHWIVPVHGLTFADPDGTVQASARRDGTVILRLACGEYWITMQLDVCRAAQLSTGIWEAAGAAQQLTSYLDDDQPPPPPSTGSGIPPLVRRMHSHRSTSPPDRSPRRPTPVSQDAAMMMRTIGLRIHRIRKSRDKSLQVIAGLAGMSKSTLHRIEHGQRELTLSEIMALAIALEILPSQLIGFPILGSR
jgi:DNA-binding Xre family transcriptional regulator